MERERIQERDVFTYDEKLSIGRKSEERCCHCGKKVFFGYGASVDHFIPLSKGGTNRMINLIQLCEKCNGEKGDRIVDLDYVPYLLPQYKQQLSGYLESYLMSFEYLSRTRLFALDDYQCTMLLSPVATHKRKKEFGNKFHIRAVKDEDFPKVLEYYEKYLKKYDRFVSRDDAKMQLQFWLRFGCLYDIESAGEIKTLFAFTIYLAEHDKNETVRVDNTPHINMYIFSLYANNNSLSFVHGAMDNLPYSLALENDFNYIPICYYILDNDKVVKALIRHTEGRCKVISENGFLKLKQLLIFQDERMANDTDEEADRTAEFFKKFSKIKEHLLEYLTQYPDSERIIPYICDLISPDELNKQ